MKPELHDNPPREAEMALLDDQAAYLGVLAQIPPGELKAFVEARLLDSLREVQVLRRRTGLCMIPGRDTAQGVVHHLGEALVSEAHVRLETSEGYGACLGCDIEQAVAIAITDAALQAGRLRPVIGPFLAEWAGRQATQASELRARVEATRVEMETF